MHEHTRGIDHPAERGPSRGRERFGQPLAQVSGLRPGLDLLSGAFQHGPRRVDGKRIVDVARQLVDRWKVAQLHEMSVKPHERLLCKS